MRQEFHKLVRDGIPERIRSNGETPVTRVLSFEEYVIELKKKLLEEAAEFQSAESRESMIEEIADIREVLDSLTDALAIALNDLERMQKEKREKRGGFSQRIFLEHVE
jgi:predicted house-cleaning noncanonical NTP pyrophosphatase (MazG superfamily)